MRKISCSFWQQNSLQFENVKSLKETNIEFPELRYFRFEDESDSSFFKYCCEKSPKLEEIHVVDSGYVDSINGLSEIVTSIGSLSSRPTLRSLLIGKQNIDEILQNIDDTMFEPLSKFFNYPKKAGINRSGRLTLTHYC